MSSQNLFSSLKRIWRKPAARVLTSICLLAILMANLPLGDLWHTITQISPWLWAFVVVAFIGGHVIGAAKWRLFINVGDNDLPFSVLVRCHFAGLFANLFLPSIAGGDVVRAGLAIRHKAKKEAVIFGGLLDRFVDISALGAIIVVSALYSPKSLSVQDRTILFSFLLAVLIFILGMSAIVAFPVVKSLPKGLNDLIQRVQAIIKQLLGNPKRALGGFFLALIIQSCFVVLNIMMGLACKIDLPLHIWFLAWPLAKLSAMLPISLGGLGVREMAFALLLDRFNIPFSRSVGLGLLWESVLVAGGAIGGFIGLVGKNRIPRADLVVAERATSKGNVTF